MGIAHSVGRNNDHLVDLLLESEGFKSPKVELAMRLVDRGRFILEEHRRHAYKDAAWRSENGDPGFLHLSAPCIYANVLEHLNLEKGMSFLNIGSGTGYLSTMVGFLIGESGINHGVELFANVVKYADERTEDTIRTPEFSAFSCCLPEIYQGNGFQLETERRYDRIYCGAEVSDEQRRDFVTALLKIGGIAVMPYEQELQQIKRISEEEFHVCLVSTVSFARFLLPNPEQPLTVCPVEIGQSQVGPKSLMVQCREQIRAILRERTSEVCPLQMRSECEKKYGEKDSCRSSTEQQHQQAAGEQVNAAQRQGSNSGQNTTANRVGIGREGENIGRGENITEETVDRHRNRVRHMVARGGDILAALQRRIQRHQDARQAQLQAAVNPLPVPPRDTVHGGPELRIIVRRQMEEDTPENRPGPSSQRGRRGDEGTGDKKTFRYVTVANLEEDLALVEPTPARRAGRNEELTIYGAQLQRMMGRVIALRTAVRGAGGAAARQRGHEDDEEWEAWGGGAAEQTNEEERRDEATIAVAADPSAEQSTDSGGTLQENEMKEGSSAVGDVEHVERNGLIEQEEEGTAAAELSLLTSEEVSHSSPAQRSQCKRARAESEHTAVELGRERKRKNLLAAEDKSTVSEQSNAVAEEQMDIIGHSCDEPTEENSNESGNSATTFGERKSGQVPRLGSTEGTESTEGTVDHDESIGDGARMNETPFSNEADQDSDTWEHNVEESGNAEGDLEMHEDEGGVEDRGRNNDDEDEHDEDAGEEDVHDKETSAQALALAAFGEEFIRRMNALPVSERMKNFLMYRE